MGEVCSGVEVLTWPLLLPLTYRSDLMPLSLAKWCRINPASLKGHKVVSLDVFFPSYRVSQQVLDEKFLVKISNLREIRILNFSSKMFVKLK